MLKHKWSRHQQIANTTLCTLFQPLDATIRPVLHMHFSIWTLLWKHWLSRQIKCWQQQLLRWSQTLFELASYFPIIVNNVRTAIACMHDSTWDDLAVHIHKKLSGELASFCCYLQDEKSVSLLCSLISVRLLGDGGIAKIPSRVGWKLHQFWTQRMQTGPTTHKLVKI
jgi:hypothetical protein